MQRDNAKMLCVPKHREVTGRLDINSISRAGKTRS